MNHYKQTLAFLSLEDEGAIAIRLDYPPVKHVLDADNRRDAVAYVELSLFVQDVTDLFALEVIYGNITENSHSGFEVRDKRNRHKVSSRENKQTLTFGVFDVTLARAQVRDHDHNHQRVNEARTCHFFFFVATDLRSACVTKPCRTWQTARSYWRRIGTLSRAMTKRARLLLTAVLFREISFREREKNRRRYTQRTRQFYPDYFKLREWLRTTLSYRSASLFPAFSPGLRRHRWFNDTHERTLRRCVFTKIHYIAIRKSVVRVTCTMDFRCCEFLW